jgi:hypothetical protein
VRGAARQRAAFGSADKRSMGKKKMTVAVAAKKWIELKSLEQTLEAQRAQLKEVLEPALEAAPGGVLELAGWKFLRVTFMKESFSLQKAKEKIDGRVLAPYITTSSIVQIRTSWKGGNESEAA